MAGGSRSATPHVVIVGCGFAGLEAARRLAGPRARLTLIDGAAEFVFRPLLSQLLAGRVALSSVVHPFREIVRSLPGATFQQGRLEAIDAPARRVLVSGRPIAYDHLLLCTGAAAAPTPTLVRQGALTMETLEGWRQTDRAIAEMASSSGGSGAFIVVGGGPHGVELAAAIKARSRAVVDRTAPALGSDVRVVLVHQGARLLESYPEAASRYAARALASLGVEVILNQRVTGKVLPGSGRRDRRIVVWAGGRRSPRMAELPGLARAVLDADLSIREHPEILVLGDLAASNASPAIPSLASTAMQMGQHAARVVWSDSSRGTRSAFAYADDGFGTYIGPRDAVVVLGGEVLTGTAAYASKMALHLALSTISSTASLEAAGRGVGAIGRRFVGSPSRGLRALERTPPDAERGAQVTRLASRVAGHSPAHVFDVAVARIDELFAHVDARVLERTVIGEGRLRMRIQLGSWRAWPIEVAFDPAHHAIAITTLATHPLRATAVIELRPDRKDTVISQTNRYQLGIVSALAHRALGLEGRITSFWGGFHDALRRAASARAPVP